MKNVVGWIAAVGVVAATLAAGAMAGSGKGQPALPRGAVKVGDDTYYLGKRTVDGVQLEGYAFIHRRGGAAKPPGPPGGGGGGGTTCYTLLASGAKWKTTEDFQIDAASAPPVVGTAMTDLMTDDVTTWETGASNPTIFGTGVRNDSYNANLNAVDDVNGAEFGAIADAGVIAVTYTWGIFSGPSSRRQLVEWDMLFDDEDFTWSTTGSTTAMDFQDIATHELGHAMGLGHPSSTCTEETMYAYASNGETKKRDLNPGDVAGINTMY